MLTSTVRLDLSQDSERSDRRAIGTLYGAQDGSRVIVLVGARTFSPPWTASQLAQFVPTHHLDVQGDPAPVHAWVTAIRGAA